MIVDRYQTLKWLEDVERRTDIRKALDFYQYQQDE